MDRIVIQGGHRLQGRLTISGAKNAALPLMAACLLTDQPLTLSNVPQLMDIATMAGLLRQHGVHIEMISEAGSVDGSTLCLHAAEITSETAPYDLVRKMRASILVLGPLLARYKKARVSLPGGCAIGARPVDLHLSAFEQMGATITLEEGYVIAEAPQGLKGSRIVFPQVSVGATENVMMAAALADGVTELVNAAREPEIIDLADCLTAMGAQIEGAGTDIIRITGVNNLKAARHAVVSDRIETGTYMMACAATGGDLTLVGARAEHLESLIALMAKANVDISETDDGLRVRREDKPLIGVDAMTEPFPGFPTDLQAQFMAMMLKADGASMITETIFENRFMHVPELIRMGASITVHGSSALVRGVDRLNGAPVMATDLRASVSLVIAGLCADGETILNRVYHLDRGYERLEEKLSACGARIERVRGEE